jgi:hypothetical protein
MMKEREMKLIVLDRIWQIGTNVWQRPQRERPWLRKEPVDPDGRSIYPIHNLRIHRSHSLADCGLSQCTVRRGTVQRLVKLQLEGWLPPSLDLSPSELESALRDSVYTSLKTASDMGPNSTSLPPRAAKLMGSVEYFDE